jgi:hypothetical protein
MDQITRLSRNEKLLGGLDISNSKGLEIGALNAPLLKRTEANIRFVDHADQETLKTKYAGDSNVNPDDIVPVDAIWGGGEPWQSASLTKHSITSLPAMSSSMFRTSSDVYPRWRTS